MQNAFFKNYLEHNPSLEFHQGLYYQKDLGRSLSFEKQYTELRKNEGRLYDDAVVAKLPLISSTHPLSKEWSIRKRSADRLINFLKTKNPQTILEVGCGNGWLIHYIHTFLQADCCGMDVNEIELKQAVSLFDKYDTLSFLYADIRSGVFEKPCTDTIILAS